MLRTSWTIASIALLVVCCGQQVSFAQGKTFEIYPGTDVFGPAAQSLFAGDTLILHQGTYNETSRLSIQVKGSQGAPITITGAKGESRPLITRPPSASVQNTINIEGEATWLTLRGLEIVGNGGDGIKMKGALSYITLEDLVIHDIDVGIGFQDNMHHITVRRNHIYNTGIDRGTGEGMYVGCNYAACIVHSSLIEQNWIHDSLPGTTQGDGIEVKVGSHSNIIRDNVIYNRAYPGIFVYGTGPNPVNIVEGNVIWNALEGIYAVADAIVRNNIVFNSGTGLSLYGHDQVPQMKNITAVNNTLYKNDDGVFMRWGSSATNMILANNAIYSASKNALNLSGSVGTFTANYVEGKSDRTLDGVAFIAGGSSSAAFVDPANNDFWPQIGSRLIGLANGAYIPPVDFNTNSRTSPYDVGAYETDGLAFNPGWRITAGFKELAPPAADTIPPTIRITAPLPGTVVSKTLTISAEASDNVGVVGVRFRLDGTDLKPEDLTAPYSITLNMSKIPDGPHTLTAVARDAAGNSTTSSPVSIIVNKR